MGYRPSRTVPVVDGILGPGGVRDAVGKMVEGEDRVKVALCWARNTRVEDIGWVTGIVEGGGRESLVEAVEATRGGREDFRKELARRILRFEEGGDAIVEQYVRGIVEEGGGEGKTWGIIKDGKLDKWERAAGVRLLLYVDSVDDKKVVEIVENTKECREVTAEAIGILNERTEVAVGFKHVKEILEEHGEFAPIIEGLVKHVETRDCGGYDLEAVGKIVKGNMEGKDRRLRWATVKLLAAMEEKEGKGPGVFCVLRRGVEAEVSINITNYRNLSSAVTSLTVEVRKGRVEGWRARAAVGWLLGCLRVKFKDIWNDAVEGIRTCLEEKREECWECVWKVVGKEGEGGGDEEEEEEEEEDYFDDDVSGAERIRRLFVAEVGGHVAPNQTTDVETLKEHAFRSIHGETTIKMTATVVPAFLEWMREVYYRWNDKDPDRFELKMHGTTTSVYSPALNSKVVKGSLLNWLSLFTSVSGLQQMTQNDYLLRIFRALLSCPDNEVATLALGCIGKYRVKGLREYMEDMEEMVGPGTFREALTKFDLSSLPEKHRPVLLPYLTRILYGKFHSKSGTSKKSKDTPKARREAILGCFCGFTEEELGDLMYMALRGFATETWNEEGGSDVNDVLVTITRGLSNASLSQIDPAKQLGFLNLLRSIVGKLGFKVKGYVPILMEMCVGFLTFAKGEGGEAEAEGVEEEDEEEAVEEAVEEDGANPTHTKNHLSSVRTLTLRRIAEILDLYNEHLDFQPYQATLFSALSPYLKRLPASIISSDKVKAPALLGLLQTFTSHPQLIPLLDEPNITPIATMIECVSPSSSQDSLSSLLRSFENLLNVDEGAELVEPYVTDLVSSFSELLESTTANTGKLSSRQLSILFLICERIVTLESDFPPATVSTITRLLIPFLDPSKAFNPRSDDVKLNVLGIVKSLIPKLTQDDANKNVYMLAKLLGPIKNKKGITSIPIRKAVVESIEATGTVLNDDDDFAKIASRLADLNATSDKHVEDYDFGKLLPALNGLGKKEGWERCVGKGGDFKILLPLSFTLLHFLYDIDGVLNRGALKAMKALVDFLSENDARLLETSVIPSIKFGVTCQADAPRKLFIQIIRHCAVTFGPSSPTANASPHLFGDLASLATDDEEVDFFRNIVHVQQHRRTRGFGRLRKLLESATTAPFSPVTFQAFLVPLANHPIFEAKTNKDEAFALEGVASLGAISRHLEWGQWVKLVNLYLVQIPKKPENERFMISALCAILDGFTEDIAGNGGVVKGVGKVITKAEGLLNKETKDKGGSRVLTLRSPVVLALLTLFQKLPDFNAKFSGLVLTVCKALRGKESDGRDIARNTLAKMALAVGIEGLGEIVHQLSITLGEGYQLHVRAATIHTILLEISKHEGIVAEVHDNGAFDECVPAIMDLIQQDVFGIAAEMKETKDVAKRVIKEAMGVKSFDTLEILSTLIRFRPSDTTPDNLSAVHAVVTPFVEMLQCDNVANSAVIRKVRACLERIVIGLSKNSDSRGEEVLKFVWATVSSFIGGNGKRKREDNDDDLEESDDENDEEKEAIKITSKKGKMKSSSKVKKGGEIKMKVQVWQPSLREVHNKKSALEMARAQSKAEHKVRDGVNAPRMTGTGRHGISKMANVRDINNPAVQCAVVFGLKLLHASLKKSKLDWRDENIKKMANPFVGMLSRCVKRSTSDEVVLLAIRNLGFLLRWDLESVPENRRILASSSLMILTKSGIGGTKDEVTQGIFKILVQLMKGDDNALVLNDSQWRGLVAMLHGIVADTAQHTATFALIGAIIKRRVINIEIYELIDSLINLVVTSPKVQIRSASATSFGLFLKTYPLGPQKVDEYIARVIKNAGYEQDDGRLSAIELVAYLCKVLPEAEVLPR